MQDIFLVFKGDYEDRAPVAVLSTHARAHEIASLLKGDVERFEVDPSIEGLRPFGCNLYANCSPLFYGDDSESIVVDGVEFKVQGSEMRLDDLQNRKDDGVDVVVSCLRYAVDYLHENPHEQGSEFQYGAWLTCWGETQQEADERAFRLLKQAAKEVRRG